MASNSSMKIMHPLGFLRASWNSSLILFGPTPTNNSINSEADVYMKSIPASNAVALAIIVFPVPGGPYKSTPFLILAPRFWYFCGLWMKSMISLSFCFTSRCPQISWKSVCFQGSLLVVEVFLGMMLSFKRQMETHITMAEAAMLTKSADNRQGQERSLNASILFSINNLMMKSLLSPCRLVMN